MTMWFPNIEGGSGPVYRQIAQAIKTAVANGSLLPGDRLPTHRDLAYHLGVTVGTITRSYREAERLGLVAGEVGRGTYVLDHMPPVASPPPGHPGYGGTALPADGSSNSRFASQSMFRGDPAVLAHRPDENADPETVSGPINFRMNCPQLPPDEHLRATMEDVVRTMPINDMITYKSEYGMARHRQVLAAMAGNLGLDDNPDRVLPTAGVQHGMTVALMTVIRPGDLVLCEELTYPNLRSLANLLQFRLRGVAMDDEGIIPETLESLCRTQNPRAIYLMPTLHNPLCSTMSIQRRTEIAEILRKYDLTLIEDGVYHFLDPSSPPPLSCFAPERSIYLDGVSKNIGGGLRVGYIHAPTELTARLANAIRTTCWMISTTNLELVCRLVLDGTLARYEAWHREEAAKRLGIILGILKGHDLRFHPSNYHLWVGLPDHVDPAELVMDAANNGVLLTAAQQFSVGHAPRGFRLCFGAEHSPERIRQGVQVIERLLQIVGMGATAVI